MSQTVVGNVTLGYRPLWNRARELTAVQLFVEAAQDGAIDAVHFVAALQELSSMETPQLLLSMHNRRLLSDMLAHAPPGAYWVEVRNEWLNEPDIALRSQQAQARGLQLVWRGALEAWQHVPAPLQRSFSLRMMTLGTDTALAALAAARDRGGQFSPADTGQIYEGVGSRALADHLLDERQALAIAGWPAADVLAAHRALGAAPDARAIKRAVLAVENDQSIEKIEALLNDEPVLAYRILNFMGAEMAARRGGNESLRHGLLILGYGALGRWLAGQLEHANDDLDLRPVTASMVLRARLTEHLLDAGTEDSLRREVYLSGLFAELGELVGAPIGTALNRLTLSPRIYDAIVKRSGPYAPPLQVARALEGGDTKNIRAVCRAQSMSIEEVNRQLLRMLVSARK